MNEIRPYRPGDRDDVYDICVRTGASGADATGLYSNDALLPDIFAGPYVAYQPDLAFVVDTGEHAAGYVIGVSDSRAYADWYAREWLPGFAARHPIQDARSEAERDMIDFGLDRSTSIVAEVADYPAHLHIDLLPEVQGHGLGRALIRRMLAELRMRGVPAVYLTMSPSNVAARAFYDRLGFHELPSSRPDGPALGISTSAEV